MVDAIHLTHFETTMEANRVDERILAALKSEAIRAGDAECVAQYNLLVAKEVASVKDDLERAERRSWQLADELPPIAFDGDPETARVLYLVGNPSFGDGATSESHYEPHPDWPLSVAGPHITPATRTYYRGTVFKHLLDADVRVEDIARRVLKVELSPWASKKMPKSNRLKLSLAKFPSRKPTVQLVCSLLDQGALVLLVRAAREWRQAIPQLVKLEGTRVFTSSAPISPYVSRGTYPLGWDLLVRALRT